MTLIFMGVGVSLALVQAKKPTGEEIARAAKAVNLNLGASATAEKDGMKVTFTPMDFSKIKTPTDLEKGQVVAVVDVKGIPELPNGKYNVFLVKSNDRWQAFFESGGRIVEQCERVEVSSTKPNERRMSTGPVIVLTPSCFCVTICSNGPGRQVCANLCRRCD